MGCKQGEEVCVWWWGGGEATKGEENGVGNIQIQTKSSAGSFYHRNEAFSMTLSCVLANVNPHYCMLG